MDVQKMLRQSILYHRHLEAKGGNQFLPKTRLMNSYVILDVLLAKIAVQIDWFDFTKRNSMDRTRVLPLYIQAMDYYLLLANLRNWNQVVLISDREVGRLKKQEESKNLDQLYLAMKKMLYNSYFFHRSNDFMYSWKLFLKWGFADLCFSPSLVMEEFTEYSRF